MKTKLITVVAAGIMVLVLGLPGLTALGGSARQPETDPVSSRDASGAAAAPAGEDAFVEERITWTLSNARVVKKGRTAAIREGILMNGYTIEADAVALERGNLSPEGTFRLTLAGFQPDWDILGRRAGSTWHVRGQWTITDDRIGRTRKARRKYGVLKGDLVADLSFNPARKPGAVGAFVRLPVPAGGDRWAMGEGSFLGNERFEGTLSMTFRRLLEPVPLSDRS